MTKSDTESVLCDPDSILYVLRGTLTVLIHETTQKAVKLPRGKTEFRSETTTRAFPTQIEAGVALPVSSLYKLIGDSCNVRVSVRSGDQQVTALVFKASEVSKFFFEPLKASLMSKLEAQSHLDMFFALKEGSNKEQANPYIMFILAMVC